MEKIPIALFGDTGMVGKELEKIIEGHDKVYIEHRQNSKRSEGGIGRCELAFLATKDPESMDFAPKLIDAGIKVIDMSGAFRLSAEEFEKWYKMKHTCPELFKETVYGMPAFYSEEISKARLVANPGCYSTAIILALAPLSGLLEGEVSINATSGISGARKEAKMESSEITYSTGRTHKHIPEMEKYGLVKIRNFTAVVLMSVFRGINANIEARLGESLKSAPADEAKNTIQDKIRQMYNPEDLVYVVDDSSEELEKKSGTKNVNNTNNCLVKINVCNGYAYISSMIDNLGKGAASQAVENMNLMLGFDRLHGIDHAYKTD